MYASVLKIYKMGGIFCAVILKTTCSIMQIISRTRAKYDYYVEMQCSSALAVLVSFKPVRFV